MKHLMKEKKFLKSCSMPQHDTKFFCHHDLFLELVLKCLSTNVLSRLLSFLLFNFLSFFIFLGKVEENDKGHLMLCKENLGIS